LLAGIALGAVACGNSSHDGPSDEYIAGLISPITSKFEVELAVQGTTQRLVWHQGDGFRRWDILATDDPTVGKIRVQRNFRGRPFPAEFFDCAWSVRDVAELAQVECRTTIDATTLESRLSNLVLLAVASGDSSRETVSGVEANCTDFVVPAPNEASGRVCVTIEESAPVYLKISDQNGQPLTLIATSSRKLDSLGVPAMISPDLDGTPGPAVFPIAALDVPSPR
jgi:hypothetical protein